MQAVAPTITDALWPRIGLWQRDAVRDLALMMGFAWFVALFAQIAIRLPWTTVPITGQTFAVLVAGGALGAKRGAGALGIYMLMGMIHIPVFAPGNSATSGNWDVHFILPWEGTWSFVWDISSGGYIVGFIIAAALVGYLAEHQWDRKPWVHLGMLLGNVSLYVPGLLWLGYLIGTDWMTAGKPLGEWIAGDGTLDKTLKGGLYPFIVGDMMKLFLASLTLPVAWVLVRRFRDKDNGPPR
jgi:biotin transport system substrate-specific component